MSVIERIARIVAALALIVVCFSIPNSIESHIIGFIGGGLLASGVMPCP